MLENFIKENIVEKLSLPTKDAKVLKEIEGKLERLIGPASAAVDGFRLDDGDKYLVQQLFFCISGDTSKNARISREKWEALVQV